MKHAWEARPLGEVVTVEKVQGDHQGLPYVGLEHIESGTGRLLGQRQAVTVKSATFQFDQHHVLYGRLRPYLNKVLAPDFRGHCSTEIFPLRPDPSALNRYFLAYWLRSGSTVAAMNATSTGSRMPRANIQQLLDFRIPVPPLAEQERIVRILDEAMIRIRSGMEIGETIVGLSGNLFHSQLDLAMTKVSAQSTPVPLNSLCDPQRPITYGVIKLGSHVDDGVPCLRTSNVRSLWIDTEAMKRIEPSLSNEYSRTKLRGGEVLVNVRGTLGGVATVGPDMAGWNVSREVAVVPLDLARVEPRFVAAFVASSHGQRWLTGVKKGTAYVGINLEDLRRLPTPIPDLKTQREISRSLEGFQSASESLEKNESQRLHHLEELRVALLHDAFSGQL